MTILRITAAVLIGAAVSLPACNNRKDSATPACDGVPATVKDLAGLDGCQYVFELADGVRLQPVTPEPEDKTNPLTGFEFTDGKKVIIKYEEQVAMSSICMAGKIVRITCLEQQP